MNLKQYIFKIMDEKGYANDQEVFNFRKRENDIITGYDYQAQYNRIKRDREFFADKKVIKISNYKRDYRGSLNGETWYKMCKDYFNEILPNYERNMERPDLVDVFDYDLIKYFYKGNKLFNVKKLKDNFLSKDIRANWIDKDENNQEKLGEFQLKDLEIIYDK